MANNKNMRYGSKEVANVTFYNVATGRPVIFFDTLKVSTIENEAETAEARGGQGNNKLMDWSYGRTASLTMQDALLSDNSLALLSGNEVKTSGIKIVEREELMADEDGMVTLSNIPSDVTKVYAYEVNEFGLMGAEIVEPLVTVTPAVGEVAGFATVDVGVDRAIVFYEYANTVEGTTQVSFTGKAFPDTYRVVGDTFVRGEDGINYRQQFVIQKAKLSPSFSLTMDVENVSTFDFNLEVLVDTKNPEFKLYDIVRLGKEA